MVHIRRILAALAGASVAAAISLVAVPTAEAAPCPTYTTRSSSWATASYCSTQGVNIIHYKIRDILTNGYCVYLATALNGQ